jgi:hypothetical protein
MGADKKNDKFLARGADPANYKLLDISEIDLTSHFAFSGHSALLLACTIVGISCRILT